MQSWGTKKRLFVYDWQGPGPLESFAPLADQPYALFLDSNRKGHPLNRYSYILWQPFEMIEAFGARVTVTNRDNQSSYNADPFQVVRERIGLWGEGIKSRDDLPPFQGGAAGYFGYDLARGIERLASSAQKHNQPDMCIGLYNKVLAFDHLDNHAVFMVHAENEERALREKSYLEKTVSSYKGVSFSGAELKWQLSAMMGHLNPILPE